MTSIPHDVTLMTSMTSIPWDHPWWWWLLSHRFHHYFSTSVSLCIPVYSSFTSSRHSICREAWFGNIFAPWFGEFSYRDSHLTGILMESSESVRIFRSLSESSESHVISSNPMEITGKSGGKSGQFGKNLIGLFIMLPESLEALWNLWNHIRIFGMSSECNLWNLIGIFGILLESLEYYRNIGIFGIISESLDSYPI